jgi:hypothetical protein
LPTDFENPIYIKLIIEEPRKTDKEVKTNGSKRELEGDG